MGSKSAWNVRSPKSLWQTRYGFANYTIDAGRPAINRDSVIIEIADFGVHTYYSPNHSFLKRHITCKCDRVVLGLHFKNWKSNKAALNNICLKVSFFIITFLIKH